MWWTVEEAKALGGVITDRIEKKKKKCRHFCIISNIVLGMECWHLKTILSHVKKSKYKEYFHQIGPLMELGRIYTWKKFHNDLMIFFLIFTRSLTI